MATIIPFQINVPDDDIELLHKKLDLTRLPGELDDVGWEIGAPLTDVKRLTSYWRNGYDWRKHEAKLNELSHFKTGIEVEGFPEVSMHFVHQKSNIKGAIPLLFVHGWPGSFFEVTRLLPLLADVNDGPAFHVVAPSLPNFGFSSRITKKGFGVAQYAEAVHKVMLALGYNEYVTQGGDWGFLITRALGHLYPQHVKAIHTNWVNAAFPSPLAATLLFATSLLKFAGALPGLQSILSYFPSATYTKQEMANLKRAKEWFQGSGRGYFSILCTKPQTMAYSFDDSPSGFLGFIWEKLRDWTDDYPWTDDEILTWISIYWFSEPGPGASGMIYNQAVPDLSPGGKLPITKLQSWVTMPLGLSFFPKEVANMPYSWATAMGKIVLANHYDKGGHFAAYERPDAIAKDLKAMFGKGGGGFRRSERSRWILIADYFATRSRSMVQASSSRQEKRNTISNRQSLINT